MRAVDTNVLVRLVVRDEPTQALAAEEFIAKGAWVSHLVLAKTVWVLDAVYDLAAEQIAIAVEMLLNHKELTVQDPDVVVSALDRFQKYPALGLSDCLIVEIARKSGHLPLGTFDRDLAKLEGVTRIRS
jgi:predicted nucleic-acid-binding protein